MGWLDRLFDKGGRADSSGLKIRLAGYPPYVAPYPGLGLDLTRDQAEANFAYFIQARPERLAALSALLASEGLDLDQGLEGADYELFLDRLYAWALKTWPSVYDKAIANSAAWAAGDWSGTKIVYSMLFDVALALGEMIVRRSPVFDWALDTDRDNGADGMITYQRIVLQRADHPAIKAPILFDLEDIVVGFYRWSGGPGMNLSSPLGRSVREALADLHARPWIEEYEQATGSPPAHAGPHR